MTADPVAHSSAPVAARRWPQSRVLLMAPWHWTRNDGGLWALRLYGAVALLLLGAPAAAALWWMPLPLAAVVVGVAIFVGLALVWGLQIGVLLRLDHPRVAHTVPGHARALRAVALGLWLGLVALCGLVSALAVGLLGGDGLRTGLVVAVGAATLLWVLALAIRWWWLWVPICLGFSFYGLAAWRNLVVASWAWLQQQWQAQPVFMTLGVLLLQGLVLPVIFGHGDGRHARAYASRERWRKVTVASGAGRMPAWAAYGRWGEWLGLPWQRLANAWLSWVCRQATSSPRSVMARAEVVMHGPHHWVRQLSTGLLVQLVVALCLVATTWQTGLSLRVLLEGGHVGISVGLASMALTAVMTLPGALWQSRREQALLVLLPGMPTGAALTRAVAWRQMRQCLWSWAVLLPALATVVWAGKGWTTLAYVAPALPLSAWLWRDASRLREPGQTGAVVPILLCVLAGGLSAFLTSRAPGALLPWLAAMVVLAAGLLAWRWRRMLHLPQVLPAGRLG